MLRQAFSRSSSCSGDDKQLVIQDVETPVWIQRSDHRLYHFGVVRLIDPLLSRRMFTLRYEKHARDICLFTCSQRLGQLN